MKYLKEHYPQSWRFLRRVRRALIRLMIGIVRSKQTDNAFPTIKQTGQWGD